jgi:hypothetical protein
MNKMVSCSFMDSLNYDIVVESVCERDWDQSPVIQCASL